MISATMKTSLTLRLRRIWIPSKKKILEIVAANKNTDAGLEKIAEEFDEDAMDNWDFQK
jgi:hypothetical protein